MSYFRIQKINALLKNELNNIFLREFDFPPDLLVTITRVDTSSNLIQAKVYISVLPENKTDEVFKTLNGRIYEIQQNINKRLKMRPVPKIIFGREEKTHEAGKIEEILEKIQGDKNIENNF